MRLGNSMKQAVICYYLLQLGYSFHMLKLASCHQLCSSTKLSFLLDLQMNHLQSFVPSFVVDQAG